MKDDSPAPGHDMHPLLARQLQGLGFVPPRPPDARAWLAILSRISQHYDRVEHERALLARSLDLSSEELTQLHANLQDERDRLQHLIAAIGEALGVFQDLWGSWEQTDHTGTQVDRLVERAKLALSEHLGEIRLAGRDVRPDGDAGKIGERLLRLADQLFQLMAETARRASLRKEMEVARAVQDLLMPPQDVLDLGFATVAGYMRAASECTGDWWAVHDISGGRALTVIGDVTGHGASSAIITGVAKTSCDLALASLGDRITTERLLEAMNGAIWKAAKGRLLMTCVASLIDGGRRSVSVTSAGHPLPYLLRARDAERELRKLVTSGPLLGSGPQARFETVQAPLESGDVLLWYTDGLIDCHDQFGRPFSEKRLRDTIKRGSSLGAIELRDAVLDDLRHFCGEEGPADDITLVVAKMAGRLDPAVQGPRTP